MGFFISLRGRIDQKEEVMNSNMTQLARAFNLANRVRRHPLKVSALWALKEVLLLEKYEECAEIIAIAKEFGAKDYEIYYLLEDPRRNP